MSENQHANRPVGLTAVDDFSGAVEGATSAIVHDDQGLILTEKPDEMAVLVGASLARQASTLKLLYAARARREEDGLPVYFTIDAEPNVHLICEVETAPEV